MNHSLKSVAVVNTIRDMFTSKGQLHYGENVTQQEHAIQCWSRSWESKSDPEMRVAAFLHDIGHLYYDELHVDGQDMQHEKLASRLLAEWGFSDKVVRLVDSHVWAKRFLVTNEPYYINRLSTASLSSLMKQGGLMSEDESDYHRGLPYFLDCLQLRRWDDEGKRLDLESDVPEQVWHDIRFCLENFLPYSGL